VTKAEAKEAIRKAKVNLRELNQKSFLINQSLSSMSAVVAAINVKKVKEVRAQACVRACLCMRACVHACMRACFIIVRAHFILAYRNPLKPQLIQGIYTSVLACFAAASSSTLRGLSIGFDLASLISRHIDHAVAAVVERIPQVEIFKVRRSVDR
jgi:hypothetical protein